MKPIKNKEPVKCGSDSADDIREKYDECMSKCINNKEPNDGVKYNVCIYMCKKNYLKRHNIKCYINPLETLLYFQNTFS